MNAGLRIYVYGFKDGSEFLHTFLSKHDARKYCESHRKVFPGRFDFYMMGDQRSGVWEIVNEH